MKREDLVNSVIKKEALVLAIESDNGLIRSKKLISQGVDGGGKRRRTIGVAAEQGDGPSRWRRRRWEETGTAAFLGDQGECLRYGSLNAKMAKRELKYFFSDLWGKDRLENL